MKYWVDKTALKYDSVGNKYPGDPKSKGLYRGWLCEIEPNEKFKATHKSIWISYNEYFDREYEYWDSGLAPSWIEVDEPEDLSKYKIVNAEECSSPDFLGYKPKEGKEEWQFPEKEVGMEKDVLRENFEKFFDVQMESVGDYTLKELLFLFYQQGHLDLSPMGEEISTEEVAKEVEDNLFLDFVKSCIENPPESAMNPSDYVEITYPCIGRDKCIAWPDRCSEIGGDGETCKCLFNISKLCGVEQGHSILIKDKDKLTTEEAAQLAAALTDFIKGNE